MQLYQWSDGGSVLPGTSPVQAGGSKKRIFESTLVILTPKRPKSNKKSASASQKVKKPKPRVEPTPAEVEAREQNRHEYELKRAERPERKELRRRITQDRRDKAKSLGLCVACGAPPIPDQTRCEVYAEQHRQYHKQARERARQQRRGNRNPDRPGSSDGTSLQNSTPLTVSSIADTVKRIPFVATLRYKHLGINLTTN